MSKSILILSIGFLPNIGGLETHLKDLIDELIKRHWKVKVLTYQPLHSPVLGKWIEKEKNLTIYRLPSLRGLFYTLLKMPALEFLFLEPLLFMVTPLVLIKYPDIGVINAQGIIAGFAGAFWARVFKKRYVISGQSVYHFPASGLYRETCQWIFNLADKIIAISTQTKKDIESLGINSNKIQIYTNWENSNLFQPIEKRKAKKKVDFGNKFVVSFFGRLVEEKGIRVLLEAAKLTNKDIFFAIYGEGPLVDLVKKACQENRNILYMKIVQPELLPLHYSGADIVTVPSTSEEGFGRVAAGALFCGTPVIASNKGALPDVVNDAVGKIIDPTPEKLAKAINFFFFQRHALKRRAKNARAYALAKFSERNAKKVISAYS